MRTRDQGPGSRTRAQGPGCRDQGPGTRDQGPGTRDEGPGTRAEGPGSRDQGPGTRDEGPGTRDQGPGTKDQGPRTKDEGAGTRDQGPGTKDHGPRATISESRRSKYAPRIGHIKKRVALILLFFAFVCFWVWESFFGGLRLHGTADRDLHPHGVNLTKSRSSTRFSRRGLGTRDGSLSV